MCVSVVNKEKVEMKFNVNDVIKTKSNLYEVVCCEGGLYKVKCIKFLEAEDLGDGIICHSIGCKIWVSDFVCWKFELVNK